MRILNDIVCTKFVLFYLSSEVAHIHSKYYSFVKQLSAEQFAILSFFLNFKSKINFQTNVFSIINFYSLQVDFINEQIKQKL